MKAGRVRHCDIGRDKEILDLFKNEETEKKDEKNASGLEKWEE